jgi:hypothetical protein
MNMNHELSTNNLYIRNGETWQVTAERPMSVADSERVYAVALVETPKVPFADEQGTHVNLRHQAVIACEVFPTIESGYENRVGWVHLGPDEKKIIGIELEQVGAEFGEWYYFILDTRKQI